MASYPMTGLLAFKNHRVGSKRLKTAGRVLGKAEEGEPQSGSRGGRRRPRM